MEKLIRVLKSNLRTLTALYETADLDIYSKELVRLEIEYTTDTLREMELESV